VRRVVEAAPGCGIGVLTLYAFSSDNWRRPAEEVAGLMDLFEDHLAGEARECARKGVRVEVIGRRDRLPGGLTRSIAEAESATRGGTRLHLRVACDYSGREAIRRGEIGPDLDLLIRTGGEQRLSDFLLWEAAYAELVFPRALWPDFTGDDLASAVRQFHSRQRRFGAVPEPAAGRELWLD
jgi:undecaprenyl diphosphate synthase